MRMSTRRKSSKVTASAAVSAVRVGCASGFAASGLEGVSVFLASSPEPAGASSPAASITATTPPSDRLSPTLTLSSLRSEEHTSELQSLMRISYAVFCLKKKKKEHKKTTTTVIL